jgi:hypothetical protein
MNISTNEAQVMILSFNRSNRVVNESMGEVRVQVKLTNAVDEVLVTVLPMEIVEQLGLRIRGQQIAKYADGRQEVIGLTGSVIIELEGRETTEATLVAGDEVLIGKTVLQALDFHVDCKNQCLIPNPAHLEYPVFRI